MAAANKSFFAYIGVMAPHLPAQPAPWHQDRFPGPNDSNPTGTPILQAPRTVSFNKLATNHFHMLATATELDAPVSQCLSSHTHTHTWLPLPLPLTLLLAALGCSLAARPH